MNLTTYQFTDSINKRFSKFYQSPFETVDQILYSPYKSTIFIKSRNRILETKTIYYQQGNSSFYVLTETAQAMSLIHYTSPLKFYYITGAVFGGFFLLGTFLIILFCFIKRKNRNGYEKIDNYSIQSNYEEILNDKSITKIKPNDLVLGEKIGMGGQSLVRRGKYKGKEIAAKSILNMGETQLNNFLREIKILSTLDNKNILKTYGVFYYSKEL